MGQPLFVSEHRVPAAMSERIIRVRPLLIFFVLITHANRMLIQMVPNLSDPALYFFQFGEGQLGQLVVPLFFFFAGYLFMKRAELSLTFYVKTVRQKFRRLLMPFFAFNLLVLVLGLLWPTAPGLNHPASHDLGAMLRSLWSMEGSFFPLNYPLWFLRELFMTFLLVPVMLILYRELPIAGILLFVAYFIFGFKQGYNGPYVAALYGACFYFGGLLCHFDYAPREDEGPSWAALALYLAVAGWLTYMRMEFPLKQQFDYEPIMQVNRLVGCYAIWRLATWKRLGSPVWHWLSGLTFALYLMHEPWLSIMEGSFLRHVWQPTDTVGVIAVYAAALLLSYGLTVAAAAAWRRYLPRSYHLLTGT